ncbi:RNA polymerase sigma factor [Paenibacillus roseipurpureus]|uniref:Sigma-70 family RNA polymerase sigma factor n=1 Tax=Paenibacillus roseopurpureus TaxID=2918901 RepID=A0AA96LR35_9BACL|nr:sigma-70 family RNA polymerase sigma factor [Paenibacillus sp. MBLB1832]WNR45702.1 sigma-70 family RNA polymerase sigma factor [Paenibacillus sp. MBLB1832]
MNSLREIFTSDFNTLDKSLQEQIYREFYLLVYPMIQFILRDHSAVEDIIQESFLRAVQKASLLTEIDKCEGWLKRLARNVTLNHLRKHRRNRDELETETVFSVKEAAPASDYAVSLDMEVEMKVMREAIIAYINQLSPSYRQIIAMKWIHNLSYKEMANELSVTEGVVRQRLFRARDVIKQKLLEEWGAGS